MNPNPEIYGSPDTWINNYYFGGTTISGSNILKCSRAKLAVWDRTHSDWTYGRTQLRAGVDDGIFEKNKPIDKSICPNGFQTSVSHIGKIGVFVNRNPVNFPDDDAPVMATLINHDLNQPVSNWCFFESRRPNQTSAAYALDLHPNIIDCGQRSLTVWSPDAIYDANDNAKLNGNFYIAPFTSYQSRSILLRVMVATITGRNAYGYPSGITQRTLEDWKNNYSDVPICGASLRICYADGNTNLSRMSYTFGSMDSYTGASAMFLDEIDCGSNEYVINDYKFLWYGMFGSSSSPVISLFRPSGGNLVYNRQFADSEFFFLTCYGIFQGAEQKGLKRFTSGSTAGAVWQEVPYSDDTYDKLMSMAALFGCPFTPTSKNQFPHEFTDSDLCLPIIDDNGITHGEYTRGSENADNPFIELDSVRDKDYKPGADVDPNTYSNTTGFNSLSGGATATIKYVLDSSNVRQLLTDLWTISHNIAGADYENYDYKILDSFLVSNPIDSIVSIKRFPFEIPHTFSTQKTNVCLGKNTGSAQGYVTHNVFNSVVFSGVEIYPKFGNSFLDYAPYTEYELYIPFCGTVKLNAGDILGHTLNCRLQIDLTTGACVAYIMADNLVIETASGVVSCELQVAGTDSATVDSAIQNAVINHIGARTNKEIAMLSPLTFGGLLSAVSNPVKTSGAMENANNEISRADYNLTHIQTPVHSMGSAGGLTGWIQEFNARLIIYYPEGEAIDSSAPVSSTSPHLADLTAYAHNVGFACVMNGTVSEFHGKTVGNIDTSSIVGATEEERAQIKALFAQGVWLP